MSTWRLRSAPERVAVEHVSKVVDRNEADAWVVTAGPCEVGMVRDAGDAGLRAVRADAAAAHRRCGTDKVAAVSEVTGKLAKLGHRRIVLLVRPRRRLLQPGAVEQAFLDELSAQGLPASDYSVPDWKESVDGFHACLDSLFRTTPPTAPIVDEPPLFAAAQQILAEASGACGRGKVAPGIPPSPLRASTFSPGSGKPPPMVS